MEYKEIKGIYHIKSSHLVKSKVIVNQQTAKLIKKKSNKIFLIGINIDKSEI